jgi:hypothetical protein
MFGISELMDFALKHYVAAALLAVVSGCSSGGGTSAALPSAQGAPTSVTSPSLVSSALSVAGVAGVNGVAIDAGGSATGNWVADAAYAGGWSGATTHAIDTSRVTNPAPQAVYQTSRVGNFMYTVTGLSPSTNYTVRLHFSETFWNAAGKRVFNATINGRSVLANFDIFKDSGGENVADIQSSTQPSDASGALKIIFSTVTDNATVAGIEVLRGSGSTIAAAAPTSAPAASAPAASGGSVATYDGCNIGAAGDAYNADVSGAAVDANSAAIIASQTNVDSSNFAAETYFNNERINLDEGDSAAKYPVTGNPSYHPAPAGNWPWASGYYIQANGAGDAHSFVLDGMNKPNGCREYEAYNTSFTGSAVHWYNGIMWPLGQAYVSPAGLGYPNASSTQASGLSMFFGLVKLDELVAGNLRHAVNFDAKVGSLGDCYVSPASVSAATAYQGSGTAHEMCFGAHLRLHASFASAACSNSVQASHIVYGLMHYGGYESDTGNIGNGIYPADSNVGNSWDALGISACLATIHMTDFDVLTPG